MSGSHRRPGTWPILSFASPNTFDQAPHIKADTGELAGRWTGRGMDGQTGRQTEGGRRGDRGMMTTGRTVGKPRKLEMGGWAVVTTEGLWSAKETAVNVPEERSRHVASGDRPLGDERCLQSQHRHSSPRLPAVPLHCPRDQHGQDLCLSECCASLQPGGQGGKGEGQPGLCPASASPEFTM